MGTKNVNVSQLQFGDDTLLLMDGEQRNIQILKSLILCFKLVSSLEVNWNKTHLSTISVPELFIMANRLGYAHKGWPPKYLG